MPCRLDTSTFKKIIIIKKKTKNNFKDYTLQENTAKSTKGILNPIANDAKQVFLRNIGFSNKTCHRQFTKLPPADFYDNASDSFTP